MMKIITWNIRGLNGISKQRILRDYIKVENPDVLLLKETKCAGLEAKTIFRRSWRCCDLYHQDSMGASGGLDILWNPHTVMLNKLFSMTGTLATYFTVTGSTKEGAITNVYGPQSAQDKESFIQKL